MAGDRNCAVFGFDMDFAGVDILSKPKRRLNLSDERYAAEAWLASWATPLASDVTLSVSCWLQPATKTTASAAINLKLRIILYNYYGTRSRVPSSPNDLCWPQLRFGVRRGLVRSIHQSLRAQMT